MAAGCFLILCGIPASGKTSFAKYLIQKDFNIAGKHVHYIYINYDDFIPENLPIVGFENTTKWKEKRKEIANSLEQLILSNESTRVEETSQILKERSTFVSHWCLCATSQVLRSAGTLHVFVIDDNMFYRSMRYEYYQLARKTSFCFAEVFFQCPVEVALSRNSQRAFPVSRETIMKMYNCIERPEPEKFSWEKFSITINSRNNESEDKWRNIAALLENAVPAPAMKVSDDALKAEDRVVTEKSIVHQADQVIRKYISQKLDKVRVQNLSSEKLKQEALSLNQHRKKIMKMIKTDSRIISHAFDSFCSEQQNGIFSRTDGTSDHLIPKVLCHSEINLYSDGVWENFWDIVSPEEFENVVKNIFETT